MADEIQNSSRDRVSIKWIIYAGIIGGIVGASTVGFIDHYGESTKKVKNVSVRNVAGDFRDDVIITYKNGTRGAFIQQENFSKKMALIPSGTRKRNERILANQSRIL